MRGSVARKDRDRRQKWLVFLIAGFAIAAFAGIIVWKIVSHSDSPDARLCPSRTGPSGHVVLLVDKTDPLSFTQARALRQILEDGAKGKYVLEGELLSVFVLGDDFRDTADPIFERCNPGDGSTRSKIYENPELWKRKFESEFVKPLLALEPQMRSPAAVKNSPILEMLQVVALSFAKHDVQGRRNLVVVSDMLHNTAFYSQYRDPLTFQSLKQRPEFTKLRSKLDAVDVEIYLLMHSPQLQSRRLVKFWEDFLRDMGGRLQKVELLPG